MDRAISFDGDSVTGLARPLVIVVGDKCRGALKTLWPDEYEDFCCDTMEQAIALARTKVTRYNDELEKLHQQWNEEE
jgi:hypothetical protein